MKDIKVKWTGKYPALCHGYWIIEIDWKSTKNFLDDYGSRLEDLNDEEKELYNLLTSPMWTFWTYNRRYFDNKYNEHWEEYTNGLEFDEWFESDYKKWLEKIFKLIWIKELTKEEWKDLYNKIQKKDFRMESCGGCI